MRRSHEGKLRSTESEDSRCGIFEDSLVSMASSNESTTMQCSCLPSTDFNFRSGVNTLREMLSTDRSDTSQAPGFPEDSHLQSGVPHTRAALSRAQRIVRMNVEVDKDSRVSAMQ